MTVHPYPPEILHQDEDDGTIVENVTELREKVVGHRIVSAEKKKIPTYNNVTEDWQRKYTTDALILTLENGHQVQLRETHDCCAYTVVDKFLLNPESVDHVIMGIGTTDEYTTWHIYADFGDIMTLDVGWSCGNPFYYGYGFDIQVDEIIDTEEVK
jgi:hypothetical protein